MQAQPEASIPSRNPQQLTGEVTMTGVATNSQRAYARFAGLMYFLVLGFDVAGVIITSSISGNGSFLETAHHIMASETLYRIGLCCSLVGSLSTILLAIGLYVVVKPVDENLAMMALVFRVIEAATGAMGIIIGFAVLHIYLAANHANAFSTNQLGVLADVSPGVGTVSAIFFSVGSTLFFYLFLKATSIPKILSTWGVFASLVYAVVWFVSLILPQYSVIVAYGSLPILIAELSTGLWLLIKGVNVAPSEKRARASA